MHWSAPRQPNAKPRQPTLRSVCTSLTMSRSSSSVYTKSPLLTRTRATTSAASASAARTSVGDGVRPPTCNDDRAQTSTRRAPPLTALRTLSRLSQHASRMTAGAAGGLSVGSSTSHAGCSSSLAIFLRLAAAEYCLRSMIDACSIGASTEPPPGAGARRVLLWVAATACRRVGCALLPLTRPQLYSCETTYSGIPALSFCSANTTLTAYKRVVARYKRSTS